MANKEAEELAKSEKQSADEEALANEEKARAEAAKQLADARSNGDALFSAGKLDGAKDEYEKAITLGAGSDIDQKIQKINAKEDDCFWVSAFSEHGFSGNGSLVKISDGQNINYLEKEDITNTYQIKDVLKRARADIKNWGYDE